MNCPKCNQAITEGSKFCEFCGAKIETPVETPQPEKQAGTQSQPDSNGISGTQPNPQGMQGVPQGMPGAQSVPQGMPQQPYMQQRPPRKPVNKGLVAGIAAVVVVVAIIIGIAVNHKSKIDLADYTEVSFSGYDTYGKATIQFDEEALLTDLEKKAKNIKKSSDVDLEDYDWSDLMSDIGGLTGYYELCEDLDWTLDKDSNLSNGDEVTVSYTFNNDVAKKYGIKFVGKDKTFEVSGLEEIREVDPFADVTVDFSGTAPDVYAEVVNNSSDEAVESLYFYLDKSSGISKGDTVVVSVEYDEDYLLEEYGCKLTSTSKEFTCDSVDAYITDGNDIGDTVLEQMQSQSQDTIEAYFAQNADYISVKDLKYEGYYFLSAKDQSIWGAKNIMYVVYSGKVSSEEEDGFKTSTVYFPIEFENVIKYADGTDYVDLNSAEIEGSTSLEFDWWSSVRGYEKISNMKNDLVTSRKTDYNDATFGDLE
jgi:hypothetical protein